ncbi:Myelin expression factor 2 [Bulinus truncatus]|nr:Myelin expression factor 2 [Bulinus truncatus]
MSEPKQERPRSRSRSRSPVRRSRSRSPNRRNRNDRARPFTGGRRVVVRNIPYEIRWQELKDMFRKDIGDVTYVEMLETPDGKSKGVAVVEFRDPEHAKKAIEEYHQKKIKDRAIIVREEREKDRQEFIQHQNMRERGGMEPGMGPGMGPVGMVGGGGGGLGPVGLPPGINPQILQQLGIEPPITNTVFVANLDYKVTWWKLKDVFKLAGNVIKAEIKEDKNGKSRGMGVVVFEHPMEAVQAVSMFNGQVLYERNMIVRIDKGREPEKPKLPSGLKSIGMGLGSGGAPLTNISQLGNGGLDPYFKQDLGIGGGSGLMGMGGSGLGLLGSGMGGGPDLGIGGLGGLGGLGGMGMGLGSGSGSGGMGLGLGGSDLGLGGMGGSSKMGLSDNFSNSYSGMGSSSFNGSSSLSGLGGLGPSLSSLSAGLGGLGGSGDRLGLGGGGDRMGLDGIGMGRDRMGMDRMGMNDRILNDRIGGMSDRMVGLDRMGDKMRDNYGVSGGREMRDLRDDGGRRTTRPDNCTIVVKNLPYSINWQTLKEHFRDAGDVKFAEIVMDKGRSTGVGYVRFSNEADAQRAISLKNKSRMERRNIDVSLHRN